MLYQFPVYRHILQGRWLNFWRLVWHIRNLNLQSPGRQSFLSIYFSSFHGLCDALYQWWTLELTFFIEPGHLLFSFISFSPSVSESESRITPHLASLSCLDLGLYTNWPRDYDSGIVAPPKNENRCNPLFAWKVCFWLYPASWICKYGWTLVYVTCSSRILRLLYIKQWFQTRWLCRQNKKRWWSECKVSKSSLVG